jgi:lysophospholipase L1-like esterase
MSAGLFAAKLALGPVLLPQARWLKRTAVRLPEPQGPREGQVGLGDKAVRLLVLGDSSAAGVGVAQQSQALALPLAQALAERLGGAVAWQLVARSGVNTAEARDMLANARLNRADVVVSVLGVNDVSSQVTARRFTEQTQLLWDEVRLRTGARWAVVCGLPPMHMLSAVPHPLRWYLGRYAEMLDGAIAEWAHRERLGFCGLRWASDPADLAADGFHPGPGLYPQWARRLADLICQRADHWMQRA